VYFLLTECSRKTYELVFKQASPLFISNSLNFMMLRNEDLIKNEARPELDKPKKVVSLNEEIL